MKHIQAEVNCYDIYTSINDWIKHAETKASTILAVQTVFIGLVLTRSIEKGSVSWPSLLLTVSFALGFALNMLSMLFCFLCLNPNLRLKQIKSPIYFGSIAVSFKTAEEYSEYAEGVVGDPQNLLNEVSAQIFVNSQIALKKYRLVGYGTRFFIGSMFAWLVFMLGLLL